MSSKTISLSVDAYDRLRAHRRVRNESFSQVVMRARWPDETVTAGELLELWKDEPALLTDAECEAVDKAKAAALPPEDKWKRR